LIGINYLVPLVIGDIILVARIATGTGMEDIILIKEIKNE